MLPFDIWLSVFENLTRDDLDTMKLLGRPFRAAVEKHFEQDGPYRGIKCVDLWPGRHNVIRTWENFHSIRCETWEELTLRLRHSRIERVVFKDFITFDEDILAKLKPLSQYWPDASIRLLWPFSSAGVLRAALSEVLLCQGLEIVATIPSEQVEALGTSLLQLPALQRCQSLLIARSVGQASFTAREIFDWLHLSNGRSGKKFLRIPYSVITDALVTLVTDLLKDFKEAETPCPFEIEVFEAPAFDRRLGLDKSMNDRTLESFTVIFDTDNLASIERKPVLEVANILIQNLVVNE